jgi:uncharacterized protein
MTAESDSVLARLLRQLAAAACAHRGWWVFPQVLLAAACVLYAARGLKLDMNRDHLVGPRNRTHQVYLRYRKEFPGGDELVVVVESGNRERNRQFIERLAGRVEPETNLFTDVFYKGDLATLGPKALLLVPTKDLEELRQTLHGDRPAIQEFTQATNLNSLFSIVNEQFRHASSQGTAATESLINALPFLQSIIEQARQSLSRPGTPPSPGVEAIIGGGEEAEQQTYITFARGRIYLLTARPRSEALTSEAITRLRQLVQQTQFEVPGLNAGLTGEPVLDYDETRQAQHDSLVASLVALSLCSLIFVAAYGEVGRPLKAAFCLFIGLGYTMGFTTLAVGHLNILTVTFAPMLIGLAIDFGVHFSTRYEEEVRHGRAAVEAVETAMVFTGQGIVTGALTTAAAFLAMALTHFKGIQEMGIISGGGLLLCLVPMMTTLPVLLMRGRRNLVDRRLGAATGKRVRIESLWMQRPMVVVSATVLLCAGAALEIHKVYFDYDLLHMQSPGLAAVNYEKDLIHSAERSVLFAAVIADSARQAREYEEKIRPLPSVASVESIADYFTEDQGKKLAIIRSIKREVAGLDFAPVDRRPVQLEALGATLWDLMGYAGLAADAAQPASPALARQLWALRAAINELLQAMGSGQPGVRKQLYRFRRALFDDLRGTFDAIKTQDTRSALRPQDLPPALRDRFIGVTGKYLLQVYPRKDIWQRHNQREFIDQLESVVPADRVTGTPVEMYEDTTLLKDSYQQAAVYSLIAIAIMVFLHFRSVVCVLLAMLPVGIGTIWLLGAMGATGIPFNPANIMTLPLVVGIGVTNGIQVLNRVAEERSPGVFARSTGKAVLVSGLAAIAGFGSLMLAKHQGIKSLGQVMSVGLAACMIPALTLLPALLVVLMGAGWTLPAYRRGPRKGVN